jgi:hypothetical protein
MVALAPSSEPEPDTHRDEGPREFGYYVFRPALVFGFLLVATVLVCVVTALVDALWAEVVSGLAFARALCAYLGRVYLQVRSGRVVTDARGLTFTDWRGRQTSIAWDQVSEIRLEGWPRDLRWRRLRFAALKWDRTITLRKETGSQLEIARGLELPGAVLDEIVSRAGLPESHKEEWTAVYGRDPAPGSERADTVTGGGDHDDI